MKAILVDAVRCFVVEKAGKFEIFQEMKDLLDTFPTRKIILTGASDEQFKKYNLDNMPWEVFTLKHNPEKTDPEYFKILLEKFGLQPEEVLYFEHNPEAVKSAESMGIKTLYYNHMERDLSALQKFLEEHLAER
jgi:HAD superfamily hydrolase (TIGR01509 family)